MIIRNAVTEDAESLLGIYSYYVEKPLFHLSMKYLLFRNSGIALPTR